MADDAAQGSRGRARVGGTLERAVWQVTDWCSNPSYVHGAPCGCPAHEAREAERERQEQKRKERK